jgi:hypothetical protein
MSVLVSISFVLERIPSYQFARGVISIIKIAVNALHRACPIRKFQVKDSAYND